MIVAYSLASVLAISLISLLGLFTLSAKPERVKKISLSLVSFAVGALFGDAFIHLLPEAFEKIEDGFIASVLVIAGIIIFFVLEKFLRWRHCHVVQGHYHPVATMNLVGDGVHNFIDGIIIASSFMVSLPLGITSTIAVFLHEIPQELGDFGVLVHSGMPIKKIIMFNFLSALMAVFGAGLVLLLGNLIDGYFIYALPLTAGGFIYIAGSDLVPELHHETKAKTSLVQFGLIILGILVMSGLLLLE